MVREVSCKQPWGGGGMPAKRHTSMAAALCVRGLPGQQRGCVQRQHSLREVLCRLVPAPPPPLLLLLLTCTNCAADTHARCPVFKMQAAAEVAERALFATQEDLIAARYKLQH